MLWLPITFVLSFGFGQLFKGSQRRGCHAPTVVAVNYLCLALLLLLYLAGSSAVVILDNAFAHLYWREALDRWTLAGAGFGSCAMLLVL